ncbi:MAG: type II secretion system protein E [Candidatus Promineifilaceae bacterium]|jgi:type II secretion system protein E
MTNEASAYLAALLKRTDLFSDPDILTLMTEAREGDRSVTQIVADEGYAQEDQFLEAMAKVLGIPYTRLGSDEIPQEVLELLPTKAVFQYNVMPVSLDNDILTVATNDPLNTMVLDALRLASRSRVKFALCPSSDIEDAIKAFYGVGAETVDQMMLDDRFDVDADISLGKSELSELDQEASIVKFVNQIISEAVKQGATDIHVEPMEKSLRIRYRIDGVLHHTPVPSQLARFQNAIISRIKVMANLDIAEKRLPMDGRIGLRVQGRDIDIRVSTMPTVYGESISLRILQSSGSFIGLKELGMSARDDALINKVIHRPNGIILVTGPTGSGKSTSLYAYLHEINRTDVRILTAEDPIEYEMAGVNQVLVRADIGLTFARALRSFLRQDPDIIMVGEIRDRETAEIAIQASLTGHLVFSTLHTNDASGSFTRLLDMGVEPFLAASACEAVIAQRLIRKLCDSCKVEAKVDAAFLKSVGFPDLAGRTIYDPNGCDECRSAGYRGRRGIFEVLSVTDEVRSLVTSQKSSNEIRVQALKDGMLPLRDDGWEKVLKGVTTVKEVLRVTEDE